LIGSLGLQRRHRRGEVWIVDPMDKLALLVRLFARGGCGSPGPAESVAPVGQVSAGAWPVRLMCDWPAYTLTRPVRGSLPPPEGPDPSGPAVACHTAWTARCMPVRSRSRVAFLAATEAGSLVALDAGPGLFCGGPISLTSAGRRLPCGDIDPVGVTGTPVYNPASREVSRLPSEPAWLTHCSAWTWPAGVSTHGAWSTHPALTGYSPAAEHSAVRCMTIFPTAVDYGHCGQYLGLSSRPDFWWRPLLDFAVPPLARAHWAPLGQRARRWGFLLTTAREAVTGAGIKRSVLRLSARLQPA